MAMASRLDGLNLNLTRLLIVLGVCIVVMDYLRRGNIYTEAYFPLPLPSNWVNGLTPILPEMTRPDPPRRTVPQELAWLIKRGDSDVAKGQTVGAPLVDAH